MGSKGRQEQAVTHDEWGAYILEWRASGLSQAEYVRRNGLNYWAFRNWVKKLSTAELPSSAEVRLVAVEAINTHTKPHFGRSNSSLQADTCTKSHQPDIIEFHLSNHLKCRFVSGTDPHYVTELLTLLASAVTKTC